MRPDAEMRSPASTEKPAAGFSCRLWGGGVETTIWNGTCSFFAPATDTVLVFSDQTRFDDSGVSSGRTFCTLGTAQTSTFSTAGGWMVLKDKSAARNRTSRCIDSPFQVLPRS